ncbi:MAG: glycoside hydrolase family 32 protein [Pirellulaceae bacterium]|nr:glycoside hydrolase family 32 protein [Pirellulaceae bacterium]HJN08520.1 glycoside hydrolase family 32 protein [Pirellulaceae bacterium]
MNLSAHATTVFVFLAMTGTSALAQEAETRASAKRADVLVADFEGETYGDWKVEGEAFGPGPAQGTLKGQMDVSGYKGKRLINTFFGGDITIGTLTSPPVKIERDYLIFLIGGGGHEGKTCMNLLLDGRVVRSVTGTNNRPGGSEALEPAVWDVTELKGKTVHIQIVDAATGGWGHVNVDHVVQTDTKPKLPMLGRQEATFTVENKYLIIPIQNKGGRGNRGGGQLQLHIDGEEVRNYGLHLAPSSDLTDWYAFFTIDSYKGKEARVVASKATEEGFALVKQSDTIPGEERFYKEDHRPQFHFTQKVGWNNDPNGMVYHDGRWHFFFQHNPVALPWGNMTWGHAISEDLLHWQQQPNKLFPKTMAVRDCFSGGATVDKKNTAGWGENTLVAFFTDTGCGEAIAYSTDGGDTFTYYENNPVVEHKGRDPKVTWYEYDKDDKALDDEARALGGHWVMVVYDENEDQGRNAAFYTSTNMKQWTEQSHLPGYFECTELFELPIDGDETESRWIVFAADAKYAVGTFDGKTFTPEHEGKHQVHWGPYYASQTFDNAPDGRKIQMGWLRVGSPGPYNQHFSFPHRLTLRTTEEGIRMFAKPIKEIEDLRARSNQARSQDLVADQPVTLPAGSDLLDVRVTVEVGNASAIVLNLPGRSIKYDVKGQKLNGTPLKPMDGKISIQVLADRSLTEIIGNDGRVFISGPGPTKLDETGVSVVAEGGNARLVNMEAHELKSIW